MSNPKHTVTIDDAAIDRARVVLNKGNEPFWRTLIKSALEAALNPPPIGVSEAMRKVGGLTITHEWRETTHTSEECAANVYRAMKAAEPTASASVWRVFSNDYEGPGRRSTDK